MSAQVAYAKEGAVAVLTIENPPVNALNVVVVTGLRDRLRQALADAGVRALVVTGAGRAFVAGADISEFGKPRPKDAPQLFEVVEQIEASPKPVVAAVNGIALGGGLEIALGCHYRVAAAGARVGLPEVTLGIIPGACGTQRTPRAGRRRDGARPDRQFEADRRGRGRRGSASSTMSSRATSSRRRSHSRSGGPTTPRRRAGRARSPTRSRPTAPTPRSSPSSASDMAQKFRGFEAPFAARRRGRGGGHQAL